MVLKGLSPGQVSRVVRTEFGFHILRLEERRPPATPPFEEVRDEVAHAIVSTDPSRREKLLAAEIDGMKKKYPISILSDRLEAMGRLVPASSTSTAPPR